MAPLVRDSRTKVHAVAAPWDAGGGPVWSAQEHEATVNADIASVFSSRKSDGAIAAPQWQWKGHIRELDGLRGIAILFVLLHHFWPASGPLSPYAPIAHLGWIGVDLFFVISGFLITGILLDTRKDEGYFRNFYARRTIRIFPLYYLFVAAVFLVIPAFQSGPYGQTTFLRESGSPLWYLAYLGNVREAITGHEPAYFVGPLWSLSIEEQFYLVFPLLVSLLSTARLKQVLVGAILAAPVFRLVMLFLVPHNERIEYLATPSRMDEICWGGLLALVLRTEKIRIDRSVVSAGMAGMIALLVLAFRTGGLDRLLPFGRVVGYSLVALTFASVVLWAVTHQGRLETALLRARPLRYLGKICYGVYLLQRPAEVFLVKVVEKLHLAVDAESPLLLLAKCATTIGVASASWYLFEGPLLRFKGRFTSKNHPAEAPPQSVPREPARAYVPPTPDSTARLRPVL